jgi:hypothetical protein
MTAVHQPRCSCMAWTGVPLFQGVHGCLCRRTSAGMEPLPSEFKEVLRVEVPSCTVNTVSGMVSGGRQQQPLMCLWLVKCLQRSAHGGRQLLCSSVYTWPTVLRAQAVLIVPRCTGQQVCGCSGQHLNMHMLGVPAGGLRAQLVGLQHVAQTPRRSCGRSHRCFPDPADGGAEHTGGQQCCCALFDSPHDGPVASGHVGLQWVTCMACGIRRQHSGDAQHSAVFREALALKQLGWSASQSAAMLLMS